MAEQQQPHSAAQPRNPCMGRHIHRTPSGSAAKHSFRGTRRSQRMSRLSRYAPAHGMTQSLRTKSWDDTLLVVVALDPSLLPGGPRALVMQGARTARPCRHGGDRGRNWHCRRQEAGGSDNGKVGDKSGARPKDFRMELWQTGRWQRRANSRIVATLVQASPVDGRQPLLLAANLQSRPQASPISGSRWGERKLQGGCIG